MATTLPHHHGQVHAALRVLASSTAGLLAGAAAFLGVTWMVLATPLSDVNYLRYRSMESTAVPVGEDQLFWTTLYFLPGALWVAFVTAVGIELALWWRRTGTSRTGMPARITVTASWLTAVGFVAWSVPSNYHTPGRGPGPMIAWATQEVGWSFGWTGSVFAALVLLLTPLLLLTIRVITRRRPTAV
jgi:hypothetical protein